MTPPSSVAALVAEAREEARAMRLIGNEGYQRRAALLDRLADALSETAVIDRAVEALTDEQILSIGEMCSDGAALPAPGETAEQAWIASFRATVRAALTRGTR